MKCKHIVALSVIVLVSFGCMATTKIGEKGGIQDFVEFIEGTVVLKEGEVADVKAGNVLTVILEEDPSTGYYWGLSLEFEGGVVILPNRYFQ